MFFDKKILNFHIAMRKINFTKMNGAGNDFILIDQNSNPEFEPIPILIENMCDRRKGIGADGLLFIKRNNDFDFELEYYNSDGYLGSLCGNGARCSIKFAFDNLIHEKTKTTFLCNKQIYYGEKLNEEIFKFQLNEVTDIRINEEIIVNGQKINSSFLNNGSPHSIIFWDEFKNATDENFDNFDINKFGKEIRYSEFYKPDGTNVNFLLREGNLIKIRTYERGVEEETLACGTGTVASAIIVNIKLQIDPPIHFFTRGKDELIVDFKKNNSNFTKITLTGPAKINYIGAYNF
jgi:diaminopimelate epimerase